MKICFVTTHYLSKHASMKRSLGMAPELVKCGHSATVLLQEHPENRAWASSNGRVEAVFFPSTGVLAERRWKAAFFRDCVFDIIIYNSLCWRNAVLVQRSSGVRLMEHCELESGNRNTSIARRLSQSVLEWWSLIAFDGHICASRYLLDLFKRRAFILDLKRHIFWSPYAVDAGAASRGNRRQDNERKLIVHIGTVASNYGCFFMLDGLSALNRRRRDWHAVFFGAGRDLEGARERVKELGLDGQVEFRGYVAEQLMRDELSRADVFLSHLNDTEQDWARCPSKVYYYMAQGRPIVTPAIGENQVALGRSGFYYESTSPDDFARAVTEAFNSPVDWQPHYQANDVTWETRTNEFLRAVAPLLDRGN